MTPKQSTLERLTAPRIGRIALAGWLIANTRHLLPPLALASIFRVVNQLLGVALLVTAMLAVLSVTDQTGSQDGASAWRVAIVLAVLALVKAVLRYAEQYCGHYVAFSALASLRQLFIDRLLPQAPAATEGAGSGDLSERATRDIDRVEVFFAHTIPPALGAILVPALALTWLAFRVDAILALVLVPFIVMIVAVIPLTASSRTWKASAELVRARGNISQHVSDTVQGRKEVLAFQHEQARLESLDVAGSAATNAAKQSGRIAALRSSLVLFCQWLAPVAVLWVGSTRVEAQATTWGAVCIAIVTGVAVIPAARAVDGFVADLDAAFASALRLYEVVEANPAVSDRARSNSHHEYTETATGADCIIEFDNVTFTHPPLPFSATGAPKTDVPSPTINGATLSAITLRVERPQHLALVGVSGSGKSTLAALLTRTWDPTLGTVSLDGAPLNEIPLAVLRSQVAYVSQRPYLLNASLSENLCLGRPESTKDELLRALEVSGLDSWFAELPRGLDTPLQERGGRLSGGQKQRLAIARAIVMNPRVLILDESTSQLDAHTAGFVLERITAWRKARGATVVEITHRIDNLDHADEVAVIDAGQLVQHGSLASVSTQEGPFLTLLNRVR